MTALKNYIIVAAVFLLTGIGGGLAFGWTRWKPQTVVETAAPAARQPDGSLVLARVPDAHAKPAAIIPKGQTVNRIDNVTVQPTRPFIKPDTVYLAATATEPARTIIKPDTVICPPVHVQLVLTDLPDGTHRVIASSADGRVTGGLDIAVKNAVVPRVLRWSAGALYGSSGQLGAYVSRDLGPLNVSAGGLAANGRVGARGTVGVGIKF